MRTNIDLRLSLRKRKGICTVIRPQDFVAVADDPENPTSTSFKQKRSRASTAISRTRNVISHVEKTQEEQAHIESLGLTFSGFSGGNESTWECNDELPVDAQRGAQICDPTLEISGKTLSKLPLRSPTPPIIDVDVGDTKSEYATMSIMDVMKSATAKGIEKSKKRNSKEGDAIEAPAKASRDLDLDRQRNGSTDDGKDKSSTSSLDGDKARKHGSTLSGRPLYTQLIDPRSDPRHRLIDDSNALELKRYEARLDELRQVAHKLQKWADHNLNSLFADGPNDPSTTVSSASAPSAPLGATEFDTLIDGVKPWFVTTSGRKRVNKLEEDSRPPRELLDWINKHAQELGTGSIRKIDTKIPRCKCCALEVSLSVEGGKRG